MERLGQDRRGGGVQPGAAAHPLRDDPHVLQHLQRRTQRGSAHPHQLGELALRRETISRGQNPIRDQPLEQLQQRPGQMIQACPSLFGPGSLPSLPVSLLTPRRSRQNLTSA